MVLPRPQRRHAVTIGDRLRLDDAALDAALGRAGPGIFRQVRHRIGAGAAAQRRHPGHRHGIGRYSDRPHGGCGSVVRSGGGSRHQNARDVFQPHSYDVVARPNIKRAEDIRGKKLAINSVGGGTWIGAMLWLEHFGIDPQRDQILLQSIGDQGVQSQALESGTVDVVFVDSVYSKILKQKGMNIIAEYNELRQPLVSQSTIMPRAFLQQHPDVAEGYLKGEIEGIAFAVAPKNKSAVIKTLMRRLRIDAAAAEEGYADMLRGVDRKPMASLEGMRNLQRLLRPRNPKIGDLKVEDVVDNRIMRKLDESGFIDRAYAAQGASLTK
jgi:ABC-type nitrate/sulfonate/bicarbonate transport system substrate-binding protein